MMARRPSEVQDAVVKELNAGTRETANLAECLAVDFASLLSAVAPRVESDARAALRAAAGEGVVARNRLAARLLYDAFGDGAIERFGEHRSDTVRGWACFMVGISRPKGKTPTLTQRLKRVKFLADDPHFGVREWAWLGVREHIVAEPTEAVEALSKWTSAKSDSLRRFASEATRPRGVWSTHIEAFKKNPERALAILEPLRADKAKYVQDSVANWLNDAGKTRPDFVESLTKRWLIESDEDATRRICSRAKRNL